MMSLVNEEWSECFFIWALRLMSLAAIQFARRAKIVITTWIYGSWERISCKICRYSLWVPNSYVMYWLLFVHYFVPTTNRGKNLLKRIIVLIVEPRGSDRFFKPKILLFAEIHNQLKFIIKMLRFYKNTFCTFRK